MTTTWGPAFDAEIDYRRQRAQAEFGRRLWWRRSLRTSTTRTPQVHPQRPA